MKKHLVCILITSLAASAAIASCAQAQIVDPQSPPALNENGQFSPDTPTLIMTLDGNVTAPDDQGDQPNLYQAQDAPAAVDDNSTRVIAQDDTAGSAENNKLIATQTSSDLTILVVGIAGLIAAAAVVIAFLFIRKRKAN